MNIPVLISILNGLKMIKIPWVVLSVDIQGGIIMACYIALYDSKNNDNDNKDVNDKNKNNKDINYIENHNKNYKNIKNINTLTPNPGHTPTPNPGKAYNSIGLDILNSLSQIGCKWSHLNTEIINSNFLLINSCNIMIICETNMIKNNIFSNELFIRNERLLKYARMFVSTYADLDIDWNDLGE